MDAKDEQLLNPEEARKLLNVSDRGLRRLVAAGKLPFHRVGTQLRFDRDELLDATRGTPARSA